MSKEASGKMFTILDSWCKIVGYARNLKLQIDNVEVHINVCKMGKKRN